MSDNKQYAERNTEELDVAGNYFAIHMNAMTLENLVGKSEIAAELAWRDKKIADLEQWLDEERMESNERD